MLEARQATVVAPGNTLRAGLATALDSSSFKVQFIECSGFIDCGNTSLEEVIPTLLPAETDVLVLGDEIFPELGEPDEALRRGLLVSFLFIKAAIRPMMRRRYGRIAAVAPSLSRHNLPHQAVRGGLAGLVKSVAREVGTRGITANLIALGYDAKKTSEFSPYLSVGRGATAEDFASVVTFAVGEDSGYITGQTLVADGGLATA